LRILAGREETMILNGLQLLLWAVALVAMLASAWRDMSERIIPNGLVGLVAASGLGLSLLLRFDQAWIGLLAAFLLILVLGTLAHFRMMGGGDVKLLSAVSLLVPPVQIGALVIYTAVAGGILSAAYLIARQIVRRHQVAMTISRSGPRGRSGGARETWRSAEYARIAADCPVPYALAIVAGAACVLAGELQRCLYANYCFS
jgi:prepilin peptidase CpaA